jgi:DNA polymerase III delta' subunit
MSLKEIFCQDRVISILQRAYASGKVPHAYIFAGQDGVGKFTTAREFGKLLLCKNPVVEDGFADSCGVCESCRVFETGSHPDFSHVHKELFEFTEDGKNKPPSVELRIDVIREFLVAKVSVRPTVSSRKVFVVSESEKLNESSQNALLKVLEEPPAYCCIILLCTRLEDLLPTTKSRCQIVRFLTITEEKIIGKLKESGVEEGRAGFFARLADGSIGQACRWAELETAGANLYETKTEVINSLAGFKYADAVNLAGQFVEKAGKIAAVWAKNEPNTSKSDINRQGQKTIVRIIVSALNDAMKLTLGEAGKIVNSDQREQIKRLTERFDCEHCAEGIGEAYESMHWIDSAVNERLIFEQLLLNLVVSDRIKS